MLFLTSYLLGYDFISLCPMEFKLEGDTRCWVKDEKNGAKLIELYNFDSTGHWLAVISEDNTIWLQHPAEYVKNYKAKIPENEILFSGSDVTDLLINGVPYKTKRLERRPSK
jgi:hypothetical protein